MIGIIKLNKVKIAFNKIVEACNIKKIIIYCCTICDSY